MLELNHLLLLRLFLLSLLLLLRLLLLLLLLSLLLLLVLLLLRLLYLLLLVLLLLLRLLGLGLHLLLVLLLLLRLLVLYLLLLVLLLLDGSACSEHSMVLRLLGGECYVLVRQVVEPELELSILLLCGLVLTVCEDLVVDVGGTRLRAMGIDRLLCLLELLLVLLGSFLGARRLLGQLQRVCACHFGLLDAGTSNT